MSDKLITRVVYIVLALIGVAIAAVLVSGQANTSSVLGSVGSSLSCSLGIALSPITGASGCGGSMLQTSVNSTITFDSL